MALLTVGGCGVPTDGEPRALSGREIPFALDPSPRPTTTATGTGRFETATIFLVAGERLVPVLRQVQAPTSVAATVEKVLRELVTGPTVSDSGRGLDSAINPATTVRSVSIESGIATVDLSDDFVVGSPRNQILALAQLVYTVTDVAEARGVLLTLDGRRTEMITGGSVATGLPVGRSDYATYGPVEQ